MPLLSLGKFEAVVTGGSAGEKKELTRASFFYFPFFNYGFLFTGALGAGLLGLHLSRQRKAHPAWWLMAPLVVGLAASVLWPEIRQGIGVFGLMQMLGLSAFLIVILFLRSKVRWITLLTAYFAMVLLSIIFLQVRTAEEITSLWMRAVVSLSFSALWFLPVAIAILLLRGRFSVGRLCLRMAICWPIGAAAVLGFVSLADRPPPASDLAEACALLLALPLGFLVGFVLLVGLNRWCRTAFLRGLDLTEATAAASAQSEVGLVLQSPGDGPLAAP